MSPSRTTTEAHPHPSRALLLGVKFNIPAAKDIPSTTEGEEAQRQCGERPPDLESDLQWQGNPGYLSSRLPLPHVLV